MTVNIFAKDEAIDMRKKGAKSYNLFHENNLVNFDPITKNDLDIWPMTLKFNEVLAVVKVMLKHNFIVLSAAVHELLCWQPILFYLSMIEKSENHVLDTDADRNHHQNHTHSS